MLVALLLGAHSFLPSHRLVVQRNAGAPRVAALTCTAADDDWRAFRNRLSLSWQGEGATQRSDAAARTDDVWAHAIAQPEQGCLLMAKPNVRFLGDRAKELSVVLVLEHSAKRGAVGLALNRPTGNLLKQVVSNRTMLGAFGERPLHLNAGAKNRSK